jgi:hypothetical protein
MFSGDSPSRPATFFFFFPPSLHYRFRSIVRNDGQGPGCVGKWILHGAGSYSISGRQREDLITKKHSSTTVPTTWIRVSNRLQLAILGTKRYPMFDATATATRCDTPLGWNDGALRDCWVEGCRSQVINWSTATLGEDRPPTCPVSSPGSLVRHIRQHRDIPCWECSRLSRSRGRRVRPTHLACS